MNTTQSNQPLETTEDYLRDAKVNAVYKRLRNLIEYKDVTLTTLMQVAFRGKDNFFNRTYKINKGLMPEDIKGEISQFIEDIFLSTPEFNDENPNALIHDAVLTSLIDSCGEDFKDDRLKMLISIANGEREPLVPFELAKAIYDYLFYMGFKHGGYTSIFEQNLSNLISHTPIADNETARKLKVFYDMMWQYGSDD